MQMVFDQHLSAFGQLASAIRFEVGTKLGAVFVPRAEPFTHAIRRGPSGLRIRRVIADRIHQTLQDRQQDRHAVQQVAEEAWHPHARALGDGFDHEVRAIANVGHGSHRYRPQGDAAQ